VIGLDGSSRQRDEHKERKRSDGRQLGEASVQRGVGWLKKLEEEEHVDDDGEDVSDVRGNGRCEKETKTEEEKEEEEEEVTAKKRW
jgi:hypothetical protein